MKDGEHFSMVDPKMINMVSIHVSINVFVCSRMCELL